MPTKKKQVIPTVEEVDFLLKELSFPQQLEVWKNLEVLLDAKAQELKKEADEKGELCETWDKLRNGK